MHRGKWFWISVPRYRNDTEIHAPHARSACFLRSGRLPNMIVWQGTTFLCFNMWAYTPCFVFAPSSQYQSFPRSTQGLCFQWWGRTPSNCQPSSWEFVVPVPKLAWKCLDVLRKGREATNIILASGVPFEASMRPGGAGAQPAQRSDAQVWWFHPCVSGAPSSLRVCNTLPLHVLNVSASNWWRDTLSLTVGYVGFENRGKNWKKKEILRRKITTTSKMVNDEVCACNFCETRKKPYGFDLKKKVCNMKQIPCYPTHEKLFWELFVPIVRRHSTLRVQHRRARKTTSSDLPLPKTDISVLFCFCLFLLSPFLRHPDFPGTRPRTWVVDMTHLFYFDLALFSFLLVSVPFLLRRLWVFVDGTLTCWACEKMHTFQRLCFGDLAWSLDRASSSPSWRIFGSWH